MVEPGWHPDPSGLHALRFWNGASWTEQVSDVRSADQSHSLAVIVSALGAAIAGVGSFAPWVRVSAGFFTVSRNGIDGDGIYTLLLAGITGVFALCMIGRAKPIVVITLILGGLLGALGAFEVVHIYWVAADQNVNANADWGLFLVVAGGGAAAAGPMILLSRQS